MLSTADSRFWDELTRQHGHTGYADQVIHTYDQPLRLRAVRRVLDHHLHVAPRSAEWSALDLGCGTGDFVQLLLDAGAGHVHGIDISPAVAERATQRFANEERVAITTGKIQDVELPRDAADVATSVTVLQHILDDAGVKNVLCALRTAIKPDGILLVLEIAPMAVSRSQNSEMIRERSRSEWEQLFQRAGFRDLVPPIPYCPLGFYVVQLLLPRTVRALLGNRASRVSVRNTNSAVMISSAPTGMTRTIYRWARRSLLAMTYPFDYWLRCNLPSRLSYYHLFALTPDHIAGQDSQ